MLVRFCRGREVNEIKAVFHFKKLLLKATTGDQS
jgi:hypothetical protein